MGAVHYGHLAGADGLELAGLDSFFDASNVEKQAGVALGGHHVLVLGAHLDVVLVRRSELAVIGGGGQIAVAVDQHLPAHFHGLGVHAGEHRAVLGVILGAGIGQRDAELGAAEHARGVVDRWIDRVALVRENAVEALHVGQLGDLVAHEVVEANARNAAVDLVVDPGVAAVVVAVFVRSVGVVGIGHRVLQAAVGLGAHHGLGFIGDAPAHQRVGYEAGDAGDFAARWQTQHAHVARVATAPQAVVGVQFAGLEVHVGASSCMARCGGGRRCRRGRSAGLFGAGCNASRQANQCSGVDETAPAQAAGCKLLVFLIDHGLPL